MRSFLSTAAIAALVSTVYGAPASNSIPTNPKDLAAWAAARGLNFDPSYVHVPSLTENLNPKRVVYDIASLLASTNATSVAASHGTAPFKRDLEKRINGPDNRYQYTNPNEWPWRTVGKIQWSNGVSCTGQMIGPRHVLTARHCIPGSGIGLSFSPSFDNGPNPTFGSGQAQVFISNNGGGGDCDQKYDHAIVIIDQRFGDGLGYFGAITPDQNHWNQAIFRTMGYPGDRDNGQRPYRMDGSQLQNPGGPHAQLTCDQYGPIYSDSDVAPGQSGSALWLDSGMVWGVASVLIQYTQSVAVAGWASGDLLVSMIINSRNDFQ